MSNFSSDNFNSLKKLDDFLENMFNSLSYSKKGMETLRNNVSNNLSRGIQDALNNDFDFEKFTSSLQKSLIGSLSSTFTKDIVSAGGEALKSQFTQLSTGMSNLYVSGGLLASSMIVNRLLKKDKKNYGPSLGEQENIILRELNNSFKMLSKEVNSTIKVFGSLGKVGKVTNLNLDKSGKTLENSLDKALKTGVIGAVSGYGLTSKFGDRRLEETAEDWYYDFMLSSFTSKKGVEGVADILSLNYDDIIGRLKPELEKEYIKYDKETGEEKVVVKEEGQLHGVDPKRLTKVQSELKVAFNKLTSSLIKSANKININTKAWEDSYDLISNTNKYESKRLSQAFSTFKDQGILKGNLQTTSISNFANALDTMIGKYQINLEESFEGSTLSSALSSSDFKLKARASKRLEKLIKAKMGEGAEGALDIANSINTLSTYFKKLRQLSNQAIKTVSSTLESFKTDEERTKQALENLKAFGYSGGVNKSSFLEFLKSFDTQKIKSTKELNKFNKAVSLLSGDITKSVEESNNLRNSFKNLKFEIDELINSYSVFGKTNEESASFYINEFNRLQARFSLELREKDAIKAQKTFSEVRAVSNTLKGLMEKLSPSYSKNLSQNILAMLRDNKLDIDSFLNNSPRLLKGGIVHKPTNAVIGEAGSEATIPLNNSYVPVSLGNDFLNELSSIRNEIVQVRDNSRLQLAIQQNIESGIDDNNRISIGIERNTTREIA